MRVKRAQLDQLFSDWLEMIDGRKASWYGDVGSYHFEHVLNGHRIVRVVNESGGIADVSPCLSPAELFNWMHAGIHTVWEYERIKEREER